MMELAKKTNKNSPHSLDTTPIIHQFYSVLFSKKFDLVAPMSQ